MDETTSPKIIYQSAKNPIGFRKSHIVDLVMEAAEFFHWFTKRQVQLFIHGVSPPRDGSIEKALLRLERRKKLRTVQFIKTENKYYSLTRKSRYVPSTAREIYHPLGCSECGVRLYRANMECDLLPERIFRRLGSVPEGALKYPNGSLLAYEFSTAQDVGYPLTQIGKFQAYERSLSTINETFNAKSGVVFIWDIPRDSVQERIARWKPIGPYWFIDYQTFLEIPIGEALTESVYFRPDGTVSAIRRSVGSLGGVPPRS